MKFKKGIYTSVFVIVVMFSMLFSSSTVAFAGKAGNSVIISNGRGILVQGNQYSVNNKKATEFRVSNTNYATISKTGEIYCKRTGEITIFTKVGKRKLSKKVLVTDKNGTTSVQSNLNKLLTSLDLRTVTLSNKTKALNYSVGEKGDLRNKKTFVIKAPYSDVTVNAIFKEIKLPTLDFDIKNTEKTGRVILNGQAKRIFVGEAQAPLIINGQVRELTLAGGETTLMPDSKVDTVNLVGPAKLRLNTSAKIIVADEKKAEVVLGALAVDRGVSVAFGENSLVQVTVESDAKGPFAVLDNYGRNVVINPGETVLVGEKPIPTPVIIEPISIPEPVSKVVNNEEELNQALEDTGIEKIKLGDSFEVKNCIEVKRSVTIDGNNKKVSRTVSSLTDCSEYDTCAFLVSKGVLNIKNIEINSVNDNKRPPGNGIGIKVETDAGLDLSNSIITASSSRKNAFGVYKKLDSGNVSIRNTTFNLSSDTLKIALFTDPAKFSDKPLENVTLSENNYNGFYAFGLEYKEEASELAPEVIESISDYIPQGEKIYFFNGEIIISKE